MSFISQFGINSDVHHHAGLAPATAQLWLLGLWPNFCVAQRDNYEHFELQNLKTFKVDRSGKRRAIGNLIGSHGLS